MGLFCFIVCTGREAQRGFPLFMQKILENGKFCIDLLNKRFKQWNKY